MDEIWHLFLHALKDTLPILPWMLLMYILIELLENKTNLKNSNRLGGKLGPLLGSATGLIPQCGFSVMAAKLFEQKYITMGTLFAVFFATSDEAFIIMLSSGEGAMWVLPMLAGKIFVSVAIGYGVDCFLKWIGRGQVCVEMPKTYNGTPNTAHEIFIQRYLEERDVEVNCSCGRQHDATRPWMNYLVYPILHALRVAAFILLVNFVLTIVIHTVGEDKFEALLPSSRFAQPFIACLIGLIPNCASSVVLTETFLSGGILFGSCLAGLCANAGMGFVVLLKNVGQWKRNLCMIVFCYVISVCIGLLFNLVPLAV